MVLLAGRRPVATSAQPDEGVRQSRESAVARTELATPIRPSRPIFAVCPRFWGMSDDATPFPNNEARDALVLEFQRLTAKLVSVGLMSRVSSNRLVRAVNVQRAKAEVERQHLPQLILDVVLCVEDGTLTEGTHFVRRDGAVALHLESVAPTMFRAERSKLTVREMRRLFHFGWLHFRDVVKDRCERVMFVPGEDRRRTVVLDLEQAHAFIGTRARGVPVR